MTILLIWLNILDIFFFFVNWYGSLVIYQFFLGSLMKNILFSVLDVYVRLGHFTEERFKYLYYWAKG